MKPRRVSLPMIFVIIAMFIAWFVLGYVGKGGESGSLATEWLLVGVARMLLVAGMAVCALAVVIAFRFSPDSAPSARPKAGAGLVGEGMPEAVRQFRLRAPGANHP